MSDQPDFAQRDGLIWKDGQMIPWRDAQLHVLSHGLHYASSVFEGLRAYDGRLFRLRDHSERLRRSAEIMGFDLGWPVEAVDEACEAVVRENGLRDAYVRPVAWRGSEQMGVSASACRTHLAVAAWEWTFSPGSALERGLDLTISRWRRPAPYTAPTAAKAAGNYGIATLAKQEAEAKGCADALMLDWRGQVAEATGANIFFVRDGALHTPAPDCFLDGITRRTLIELAEASGLTVAVRAIWPEELETFQQCFMTGTAAEVMPVRRIGPWHFEVGALTGELVGAYQQAVRG